MQHDFEDRQPQGHNHILPNYAANVKVSDPEADSAKGFYTYLISGSDDAGSFEIRRRFNDFFYYRQCLVKKWPGIYIPPVPEKKIAGSKDTDNVELRKRLFDMFMKRVGRIKHLFTCHLTREFLRSKSVDMEKYYSSMQTPVYGQLLGEYKVVYEKLDLTSKSTHQIKANIQNFGAFLKKAEKQLQGLRSQIQIIVEARTGFTQNLNNVNTSLLPDYEKNVYAEYLPEEEKKDPNLIFVTNNSVQNNIKSLKQASVVNSFSVCLDHITYQMLQIKAMEEALKVIEKYESEEKNKKSQLLDRQSELAKLNSGKTTIKSFFSRGSKNQQIQKLQINIPDLQKEIASLEELNSIITIIFGKAEMPIFKKNKQIQYYRMMYQISEHEIKYLASYGDFMKSVLQGLNK